MASVTGFGGVFLRADDPEALYRWYEQHLGLVRAEGSFAFPAPSRSAQVVFALFGRQETYFPPGQHVMLNLEVDDLDEVLDRLDAAGVSVDPERPRYDFGRFGWITDPEGNRIELWQPAADE